MVNNFNNQLSVVFLIGRIKNKIHHLLKYGFKNWYLNKKHVNLSTKCNILFKLIQTSKGYFEIINNLIYIFRKTSKPRNNNIII